MTRTAIVGGGIAGATAALRLAEAGQSVVVIESGQRLGGLVVSFEVSGTPLECFYHHIFPHESHIRELIDELGLTNRLAWLPSSMGVMTDGKIWPFTTPLDIMRFGPMTLPERLRMGIGGLRLQRWKDWQSLDNVAARDWLRDATGDAAVRELWEPLLRAKFGSAAGEVPAAWMWGRFDQRRGARKGVGEKLGYLRGGFRQIFDALVERLEALGVEIRTATRVHKLVVSDAGQVTGLTTPDGELEVDQVLYTGALPGAAAITPEAYVDQRWRDARGMSVVCSVIETDRPITDVYWTNICDEQLGFGGLIEHTNLVPADDYAGTHVTYLGRYFAPDEVAVTSDPAGLTEIWLDNLAAAYPHFDRSCVTAIHSFRAPYAAPLVTLGYLDKIPPMRTSLTGFYLCTTGQIYPQDRGMSEGVRMGAAAAAMIAGDCAKVSTTT